MSRARAVSRGARGAASIALTLLPRFAAAQTPATTASSARLPRPWEVIERHLEASGGRAALQRLSSRDVWARYELPARHLRGELRVFSARPDRLLIKTEYPELGTAVTGFDGTTGWSIEPGARATPITGGALGDLHADAVFDRYDEDNLLSAETMDEGEFEGRRCVRLKIVRVPGRESFEYFDVATGLLAGSVAHRESGKGPVTVRTVVSRYETTDGVRLPHLLRIRTAGVEELVTVMRVRHNGVDPVVFRPPANLRRATP